LISFYGERIGTVADSDTGTGHDPQGGGSHEHPRRVHEAIAERKGPGVPGALPIRATPHRSAVRFAGIFVSIVNAAPVVILASRNIQLSMRY
jgi:hypothetical protein